VETARDEALAKAKALQDMLAVKTAYIEHIDGRPSKAAGDAFSLKPEVERLQQHVAALSAELDRREHMAALLRYQARQLLHEIALLTAEREKSGMSRNAQLVYSNQIAEGIALIEQMEVQNAGYREQLSHLSAEVARVRSDAQEEARELRKDLAHLREELTAERLHSLKLQLIVSKHQLAREEADEQQLIGLAKLQQACEQLRAENADIKQRYFYSLAVSIKLHTQGTWEVAKLYCEELPKEGVPIDGWPKWISRKMAESSAPLRLSQHTPSRSFSQVVPAALSSGHHVPYTTPSQPALHAQLISSAPPTVGTTALPEQPKDPPPIPPFASPRQ
jgi:hypothetical protein